MLEDAVRVVVSGANRMFEGWVRAELAEALLGRGDLDRAEHEAQRGGHGLAGAALQMRRGACESGACPHPAPPRRCGGAGARRAGAGPCPGADRRNRRTGIPARSARMPRRWRGCAATRLRLGARSRRPDGSMPRWARPRRRGGWRRKFAVNFIAKPQRAREILAPLYGWSAKASNARPARRRRSTALDR